MPCHATPCPVLLVRLERGESGGRPLHCERGEAPFCRHGFTAEHRSLSPPLLPASSALLPSCLLCSCLLRLALPGPQALARVAAGLPAAQAAAAGLDIVTPVLARVQSIVNLGGWGLATWRRVLVPGAMLLLHLHAASPPM